MAINTHTHTHTRRSNVGYFVLISRIHLSAFAVVCFLKFEAFCQVKSPVITGEIFCRNKDYKFIVEGNHYFDGNKVYVCPKNIPLDVTVVEATTQTPVSATFIWKVNGTLSGETSNTININKTDFSGDKAVIEAAFISL